MPWSKIFATFVLSILLLTMKYDVFISYSRKDYEDENKQVIPGNIVSQIKALFDENGITYWFDEEGIYSGDAFAHVIAKNIRASKILLFVSTDNSNKSSWTSDEIATARIYEKKIIPFRYDRSQYNESVILFVAKLDYIDYLQNPQTALNRLLVAVKEYLKSDSERVARETAEAEHRKNEEIMRQMQAVKDREMREKIVQLEGRRQEIINEILEHEKTLAGLTREKDFIEKDIADLRHSLGERVQVREQDMNDDGSSDTSALMPKNANSVLLSIVTWLKKGLNIIILAFALFCALGVILKACDNDNEFNDDNDESIVGVYNIGDYYDDGVKQGVVFTVEDGGRHGKIISLDETSLPWGTNTDNIVGVSNDANGKINTDKIMARKDSDNYPAFEWCRAKGEEWYLPSREELMLLYEVVDKVNKTLHDKSKIVLEGNIYWSSTELSEFCAWYVGMTDGFTFDYFKNYNLYVRAVSAF